MTTERHEESSALANVLNCAVLDIEAAKTIVGNSRLKVQQYIKHKKVRDNGHFLKVYVKA